MFNALLAIIDKCLPNDILASKDKVLRARVLFIYVFVDVLFNSFYFFQMFSAPSLDLVAFSVNLSGILIEVLCLYLLKKSYPPGLLVGIYLIMVTSFTTVMYNVYQEHLSAESFAWIPTLLLTVLLVSDRKAQLFFFALVTGWSLSLISIIPGIRFENAVKADVVFWLPYSVLPVIGFLYVYQRSRQILQDEFDQEMEWQLRNAKMAEISEMSRTVEGLMRSPIKSVRDQLDRLISTCSENAEKQAARLEHEIEELLRISQSFSWMYRAFRKESGFIASSELLLNQIRTLLRTKFESAGWEIKPAFEGRDIEITGPVPSLMFLLFSLASEITKAPSDGERRLLAMGPKEIGSSVLWILSWPYEDGARDLPTGRPRHDLILELEALCNAEIHEYVEDGSHFLQVSGGWKRNCEPTA